MTDEQQQTDAGEPTEEAKALHGSRAAAEKYDQPETVSLDGDTKIAKPGADPADDDYVS